MLVPRPLTAITSEAPAGLLSGIARAGDCVNVVDTSAGGDVVVTSSDHDVSEPLSAVASSLMVSVHVPFGSSPRNASRRPSGESGVATTLFAYTWSTAPSLTLSSQVVPL